MESRYLEPEDEAFNEIERRSVAKKEAVKSSVDAKEALTKLLIESYDQGVKDALESATQAIKEQRTWVGLTDEEIDAAWVTVAWHSSKGLQELRREYARAVLAKSKEKNI